MIFSRGTFSNIFIGVFLLGLLILSQACSNDSSTSNQEVPATLEGPMFRQISPEQSGVTFTNTIEETAQFNHLRWSHMYTGGGVGIIDVNNDGLQDIYFTGNLVPDRLYLNKGNLQFEDITKSAGILDDGRWSSGVAIGDVNQDGFQDIYVSRTGWEGPTQRQNLLYVNNRNGGFTEQSKKFGVADMGYSTQATFVDIDNDGDLDLFVGNEPPDKRQEYNPRFKNQLTYENTSDHLYENTGDFKFKDITKAAGLHTYSFTLNAVASDINDDGYMDFYVSNDYEEPDYIWINNKNKTFTNKMESMLNHTSQYAMGSDIADFNNDGLVDFAVVDMASSNHYRSKTNMGSMSNEVFWKNVADGKYYQYMFNALQVNNGNGTFSDIAQLAGISKTDWSWAVVLADFDNDGLKDIFITNGIQKDIRNNDFMQYVRQQNEQGVSTFNAKELVDQIPSTPISNFMYKNNGDLTFTDVTQDWGLGAPNFSNGMAHADLDNDGDLDIIVNNVSAPSDIFENLQANKRNWLRLKLKGNGDNKLALGAKVRITYGDQIQYQETSLTRGFFSSMENFVHFGLDNQSVVDKLEIRWPDGSTQTLTDVKVNQLLTLNQKDAKGKIVQFNNPVRNTLFKEVSNSIGLNFKHQENEYDDFLREILIPHKQSQNGPYISAGDANGDGMEDFYIGGAMGFAGELFLQKIAGKFEKAANQPWNNDKKYEDLGSLFFDADGDGDQDLYVVSGGSEYDPNSANYQDRLYLNDGKGNYSKATNALPSFKESGQCVIAHDYDADGDLDLFVGGRIVPGKYPAPANSYLLQNNDGKFKDVTDEVAAEMRNLGLVTDAIFNDYDQDGDIDLVMVGEWMPITMFQNDGGKFTKQTIENSNGWWWSIESGDFDKDGKDDFILGNLGKNHKFKASKDKPFTVFGNDFDNNGTNDIVLASYSSDKELLPVRGRECSSQQMPFVAEKFPTFDGFAKANIETIYTAEKLGESIKYEVQSFKSIVLKNLGGGQFDIQPLPNAAQIAPIRDMHVADIDKDGNLDVIAVGNMFGVEVETVRHDAGTGFFLKGDGNGGFTPEAPQKSGFFVPNDARNMVVIGKEKPLFIVANNQEAIDFFGLSSQWADKTLGQK
jgi:hypothetical protein